MIRHTAAFGLAVLAHLLASTTAAAGQPRVVEAFDVGETVYVRSLAVDPRRNSLWVGTSLGVHEVDLATGDLRRTFTRAAGLANEYVFAVMVDHRGATWFGTNGGGASRFQDGGWRTFFPMHGLADYWVYAFAEQADGKVWIGTWDGANRYDPVNDRLETFKDELVNEWVYGLDVDAQDRVWFATEGGVSMYDGVGWRQWTHEDGVGAPNRLGLPASRNTGLGTRDRHDLSVLEDGRPTYNPGYAFCIHVAGDGQVWVGTWGGGVSRFDGRRWRSLTVEDGLAGDIVFAMAEDAGGRLWFATNQGLSRYDGRTWLTIDHASGLPEGPVYSVTVAPNGDVWAGTRGGVAHIAETAGAPSEPGRTVR